jgi:hypothetical protein
VNEIEAGDDFAEVKLAAICGVYAGKNPPGDSTKEFE